MCGAAREPALETLVEWSVKTAVKQTLEEQVKDRKALELETAEAIVTRVWGWVKTFGIAAGVVLGILAIAFTFFGYKSLSDVTKAGEDAKATIQEQRASLKDLLSDVSRAVADAKAAIKEQRLDLKEQSARIKAEGEAVDRGFKEQQEKLLKVGGQLPGLEKQIATVQAQLQHAQNDLKQLPVIRKQLDKIAEVVLPAITLKKEFIHSHKDRATLKCNMWVDKVGRIHPPRMDGDILIAGRIAEPRFSLVLVAEVMNAKDEQQAITLLRKAEGDDNPVPITGVWRVWFEHAGEKDHIQGEVVAAAAVPNPDHLFELHPVTAVKGISTGKSLKPIAGYQPKHARAAFAHFESTKCRISYDKATITLKSTAVGYNYVKFTLEATENPRGVEDGWFVTANVRDLDGELLVKGSRMVFVKSTPPGDNVKDLRQGASMVVLGMPRINYADVARRVEADVARRVKSAETEPQGLNATLPYEIVVVGVYLKDE
jgi:hypothetical protein